MNFADFSAEDRRLAILRFLAEQADYSLNVSVTQMALKGLGHGVSRSQVQQDFDWLGEHKLVEVTTIMDGSVTVAKLNNLGVDVAQGLEIVDGVKRPGPGD